MVKIDLYTIPLIGTGKESLLELLIDNDSLRELILILRACADRADEDAERGLLPSEQEETPNV